jgi:hypothetical protein
MTALLALTLMLGCGSSDEAPKAPEPAAEQAKPETEEPSTASSEPNVIFIVLDTVRADRLSLCGHNRATSANLEKLKEMGASWTCDAYSPAPWTVPSHASYFTGADVLEHKTFRKGVQLDKTHETLAEKFSKRGYQSLALSGNMTVGHATGLLRGFEHAVIATSLVGEYRGRGLGRKLDRMLAKSDPDRALFLFVNIMDAHEPYPEIPDDAGWVPAQPALHHFPTSSNPNTRFSQYMAKTMSPEDRATYERQNQDGYDYGVYHADRNVGRVITLLERHGRLKNYRLVITSDHGEFLGEHDLLGHSSAVWEPVVKVPFVYYDSSREEQLPLPSPLAAQVSFSLLLDGSLPDPLPVPAAHSFRAEEGRQQKPTFNMVSMWAGKEKTSWLEGAFQLIDLPNDPLEANPAELGEHPLRPKLEALVEEHKVQADTKFEEDEEVKDLLREMGYIE